MLKTSLLLITLASFLLGFTDEKNNFVDVPPSINVGVGQTFTSLTGNGGAFQFINQNNLVANTVINVTSNLIEDGTFALNTTLMNNFSLKIQPADASVKVIQNNGNLLKPMIRLGSVKNITIDGNFGNSGRFLRIINTNSNGNNCTSGILIDTNCSLIKINNIVVETNIGDSGNFIRKGNIYIGNVGTSKDITIQGNLIRDAIGNPGFIGTTSKCIATEPGNFVSTNKKINILDNEILNFTKKGISLENIIDSIVIIGNHFYYNNPIPSSNEQTAISINSDGNLSVKNNFIGGSSPFCGGSPWLNNIVNPTGTTSFFDGINCNTKRSSTLTIIQSNTIQNIKIISQDDISFRGLVTFITGFAKISDNLVGDLNTSSSIQSVKNSLIGISALSQNISSGVSIFNNYVSNLTTTIGGGVSGIGSSGSGRDSVYNNLVQSFATNTNNSLLNPSSIYGIVTYRNVGYNNFVNKNIIRNFKVVGQVKGSQITGIYAQEFASISGRIKNNRIYNLENLSDSGEINGFKGEGNIWTENNQISLINGTNSNRLIIRGIYDIQATTASHFYNSIYIGGTNSGALNSYGYINENNPTINNLKNNIFYNERTGGIGKNFIATIKINNPNLRISNHNLFVTTDTANVCQWRDPSLVLQTVSMRGWKSLTLGDTSSYATLNTDVLASELFMDANTGNLNINNANPKCWYANGKGVAISSIADDFDAQNVRSTTIVGGATDIGSDEFTTTTLPPVLLVYGRHLLGNTDTLMLNGRIIATITWGNTGTIPTFNNPRWFTGDWPNDPTNNGATIGARYFNGYLSIPVTGGSNYTYSLKIFYVPSMLGTINSESTMIINKKQIGVLGSWTKIIPSLVNTTEKTITINNQTSFSEFTATDLSAPLLPLNLISFNAIKNAKNNLITWVISNDEQTDRYELEQSTDGVHFETVNILTSGHSTTIYSYQYIDEKGFNLLKSNLRIYYRLKAIMLNQNYFYSQIVSLNGSNRNGESIKILNNPIHNSIILSTNFIDTKNVQVSLIDQKGIEILKKVYVITRGSGNYYINNLERLTNGVYFLKIVYGNNTDSFKIVKE